MLKFSFLKAELSMNMPTEISKPLLLETLPTPMHWSWPLMLKIYLRETSLPWPDLITIGLFGKLLKKLAQLLLILQRLLFGETIHQLCLLILLGLPSKESLLWIWLENNGILKLSFQESKKEEPKSLKPEDCQALLVQETLLLRTWEVGSWATLMIGFHSEFGQTETVIKSLTAFSTVSQ